MPVLALCFFTVFLLFIYQCLLLFQTSKMSTCSKRHYTIVWKVKNFLSCYQTDGEHIESPTFHIDELIVKEWNLWMYPRLLGDVFIYLMRRRPDTVSESVVLSLRIEVVDICGSILKYKEFQNEKIGQDGCSYFNVLSSKEMFDQMTGWPKDTLTVRCTITPCEEELKYQEVRYDAVTVFDVDRCIFKRKFTHPTFAEWTEDILFHNSKSPDLKFCVSAPDNDLKICIQVLNETFLQKPVVIRLTFVNDIGIKIASRCEVHVFESTEIWMFPTFISKKELNQEDAINSIFKYTFFAECSVSKKNIARENIQKYTVNFVESNITQERENYILPFQKDFQGLYMSEKYSDVKLRIGCKEIFAHKAVLGTRSPVFSTMFDQDMIENQTGVVNIKEMDEVTMKQLLEFMYTDKVSEMDNESALKLLLVSDRYQVLALKDKCCSFIRSRLSVENVCEVIAVSDLIGSESLKKLSMKFICANIPGVLNTPNWLQWYEKNVRLGTEIVCNISEYMKHESVEKSY